MQEEPQVTIGLREIYDTVVSTHEAVRSYAPRLDAVERLAKEANTTAHDAHEMSTSNARHIAIVRNAAWTLFGGSILAFVSAWAMHLKW